MQALKLERYSLRILLPERQIRRRGVGSVGASVPLKFFFSHLLPCYAIIPLYAYYLPCCAFIFLRTYPAVHLFFSALTLLCTYFSSHLPCCALIFLRTYPTRSGMLPAFTGFSITDRQYAANAKRRYREYFAMPMLSVLAKSRLEN